MSDEYDYLFKCIVVGDGGCGKTAIVVRFSQGFFQEQYKLTIGVEFAVKTIELINDKKVKLQIWDTGGQERFQYVRPLYYRGSMGAIILFDLTNKESFDHIAKWMEEVRTNAGDVPLLLVGNKSDLIEERQISREEAVEFAKEFEMYYLESSAKNGTGIGDVFAILSCLMIGIDVPSKYLIGTTGLMNKNGQKMEIPAPKSASTSVPASAPRIAPIPVPEPMPVSPSKPNFFSGENRIENEANRPVSSTLPPAFAGNQSSENLTPQFSGDIPAPKPIKMPNSQDYSIPALPIQPKPKGETPKAETIPDISPEPIPEPEEWAIPEVPLPKQVFQKAEEQKQINLPSNDEIEASIPVLPKKSEVSNPKSIQGPITFDDDSISSETAKVENDAAPPPLVFDIPEEEPSANIEFKNDIPPIQRAEPAPIFPKAKPAPSPPGFKAIRTEAPPGFKPKTPVLFKEPEPKNKAPEAPKSIPFGGAMFQTGTENVATKKSGSMNSLLGALGSKQPAKVSKLKKAKPKSFMPFSGSSTTNKQKQSFFVPDIKENVKKEPIKIIQPATTKHFNAPEAVPEKKKDKKKARREKKDKKKQKGIIVCPNCGSILSGKYKFCNKCGSKI